MTEIKPHRKIVRSLVCRMEDLSLGLEGKKEDRAQKERASQRTHSVSALKEGDENRAVWITVHFTGY